MKMTNEFTVGADPDTVWRQLLDMESVAACLPGASIEATDEPDTYSGTMRVKMGPMTVTYQGTAELKEIDDEARRAVIDLRAREAKGQGTATATIVNRVEPADGRTRVLAETEVEITGAQARFGQGVMVDVASRVLDEFARRLEQRIAQAASPAPAGAVPTAGNGAPAGADATATPPPSDEALDMGAAVSRTLAARYGKAAGPALAVLLALVLAAILRRRR